MSQKIESAEKPVFSTFCTKIEGLSTEFVFHRFANSNFVLITQYETMPNLYTVNLENSHEQFSQLISEDPQWKIDANFGEDTDEIRSAIQFIVNNSNLKNTSTEIIISLGLKHISGKVLKDVVKVVNSCVA